MTLTVSQHVEILQAIREEMAVRKMSQVQLAAKIGVDPSTVSKYFSGDIVISPEVLRRITNALGSLRLRQMYANIVQVGIAPQEYLGNVDLTPAVVQFSLMEELGEALAALKGVRLINRRAPGSLPRDIQELLKYAIDQLLDVKAGVEHFLITCRDTYGIDPDQCLVRWSQKVRGRGYISAKATNLRPMLPPDIAESGGVARA